MRLTFTAAAQLIGLKVNNPTGFRDTQVQIALTAEPIAGGKDPTPVTDGGMYQRFMKQPFLLRGVYDASAERDPSLVSCAPRQVAKAAGARSFVLGSVAGKSIASFIDPVTLAAMSVGAKVEAKDHAAPGGPTVVTIEHEGCAGEDAAYRVTVHYRAPGARDPLKLLDVPRNIGGAEAAQRTARGRSPYVTFVPRPGDTKVVKS
jgi:hypothetical protein